MLLSVNVYKKLRDTYLSQTDVVYAAAGGRLKAFFMMLFFAAVSVQLPAIALSDSSRISLLTCAPGYELYSCFGHTGIRVTDYTQGFDFVFNYGTFDFEQPDFYLNFLRGHMIYMLGVDRFQDFRAQYVDEQRNIYEQELNLSADQRAVIFDFLADNARDDKRNYRYDFLFDNCATRIRDVFEKNLHGIKFDYSSFTERKSFRDLINDYSDDKLWSQFGMGMLIGLPVDRIATHRETTFLPDYLSRAFAHATIGGQPLCRDRTVLLSVPPPVHTVTLDERFTPVVVFALLLLLMVVITVLEVRWGKHFYAVDVPLFFVAGVLGCLFLALGAFTEHTTTQWNLNLLWAWPTHIIIAFVLPFAKNKKWLRRYFLFSAIVAIVMVLCWRLLPQQFLFANILIAASFALRGYSIFRAPEQSAPAKK